ncbi:MAG: hypothetical protein M3130_06820 [Actinomycetota bacterium]|nr:hypothetical protein [Actinomycetota bacterium]
MSDYPGQEPPPSSNPDSGQADGQPGDQSSGRPQDQPAAAPGPEQRSEQTPEREMGYWERQAAEDTAQQSPASPYGTTAYPASPGYQGSYQGGYQGGQPGYSPGYQGGAPGLPPGFPGGQTGYPPGYQGGAPGYPPGYQGGQTGYPPPGNPYAFHAPRPDHPQAGLALGLGIGGLVGGLILCGLPLLACPFAWSIGHRSLKEIRASQGRYGGEGQAQTGMIMGIVGSVLLVLGLIAVIGIAIALVANGSATQTNA